MITAIGKYNIIFSRFIPFYRDCRKKLRVPMAEEVCGPLSFRSTFKRSFLPSFLKCLSNQLLLPHFFPFTGVIL
jgi:hypothetical protein